jgi:hypothetical protein
VPSVPSSLQTSYGWGRSVGDVYAAGSAFSRVFAGAWRPFGFIDLAFKTYVVPPDTTPPTIGCAASPKTLWPPNHALRPVTVAITASDDSGSVAVTLTSVTSSQADRGLASDDVAGDIQGWTTGSDDRNGSLRAERFTRARTYTLTYKAQDPTGNSATCTTTVTVPQSQS